MDHVLGNVVINRYDGKFIEEKLFGLSEDFHSFSGIATRDSRLLDERVVTFAGESGLVISPAGEPHIHEGIRIIVVAEPRRAGHLVVH